MGIPSFSFINSSLQIATYHFVVMENLFPHNLPVHEAYDLKGSVAGRYASKQEATLNKEIAVLKDINFQQKRKLVLGQDRRSALFRQLDLDCMWLESHGIMDYSLFLLIHKCHPKPRSIIQASSSGQMR